jgi:hypothetical protein
VQLLYENFVEYLHNIRSLDDVDSQTNLASEHFFDAFGERNIFVLFEVFCGRRCSFCGEFKANTSHCIIKGYMVVMLVEFGR